MIITYLPLCSSQHYWDREKELEENLKRIMFNSPLQILFHIIAIYTLRWSLHNNRITWFETEFEYKWKKNPNTNEEKFLIQTHFKDIQLRILYEKGAKMNYEFGSAVHLFFFINNPFLTLAPKIIYAFLKNRPKNCLAIVC